MPQRLKVLFALGLATVLLAGCSTTSNALCPGAAALVQASALTGFPPDASTDPSQALYRVAVSNVTTGCSIDPHARTADSSLDISFVATRAPTGNAVHYRVPYFVAVRQGPHIISKKVRSISFGFAPGQASINFEKSIDSTIVKIGKRKQPYDYQILVGFQLTRKQLDYNRKTGHYGP